MPGWGGKSCRRVFWGDGPYFDGLPKPQWAANPSATIASCTGTNAGGGHPHLPSTGGASPGASRVYWEPPFCLGVTPDPFGVQHPGRTPKGPPLSSPTSAPPTWGASAGAPSLAELSGALPTLRARMNHGFPPREQAGRAVRTPCKPTLARCPCARHGGARGQPRDPLCPPRAVPKLAGSPGPPGSASRPSPRPPGTALPRSSKMEIEGSLGRGGVGAGFKPKAAALAS